MTALPPTARRQRDHALATIALAATIGFLVLLAVLHVVKDEYSPTWRIISEYEIGANGWIMSAAFLLLALGCAAIAFGLRDQVPTRVGLIGFCLLGLTAVGLVLAAVATTDPITATSEELTTHGKVHGLGALLGLPGNLLGLTLLTHSLARSEPWATARRSLVTTTVVAWLAMAVFGVCTAVMYDGEYGPDVKIGWPNRFVIGSCCAWTIAAAIHLAKLTTVPARARSNRRAHA
jgi:Protein of unknown function (DUF998)